MDVHIARSGKAVGVFKSDLLQELMTHRVIRPDDDAWIEGAADWQPVSKMFPALSTPTPKGELQKQTESPEANPAIVSSLRADVTFSQDRGPPVSSAKHLPRGPQAPRSKVIEFVVCCLASLFILLPSSIAWMRWYPIHSGIVQKRLEDRTERTEKANRDKVRMEAEHLEKIKNPTKSVSEQIDERAKEIAQGFTALSESIEIENRKYPQEDKAQLILIFCLMGFFCSAGVFGIGFFRYLKSRKISETNVPDH